MAPFTQPSDKHEIVPLSELQEQEVGVIELTDLDFEECQALTAMGLHHDAEFHLCQQGQPCIVKVEATRLGLSSELTSRIMVRRNPACNEA